MTEAVYPELFLYDYKDKNNNIRIPFENTAMLRAYARVAMQQNARYRGFIYRGDAKEELTWE